MRDRFSYNTAVADSWKEQTLLNIVKMRYADMPLFVEVSSIVAGYTLEASVNANGSINEGSGNANSLSIGASGRYTDRPTITYSPITGQQFNRNFMTPIPPQALLFFVQSGWPVDLIFPLTVDSISGLRCRVAVGVNRREGNPEYYHVIRLLREIQQSGAVGMHLIEEGDGESTVLFFNRKGVPAEVEEKMDEVARLLGLEPGVRDIHVTYGLLPRGDREISLLTRSLLQIIIEIAHLVEVPEQDVTEGRTIGRDPGDGGGLDVTPLLRIHQGEDQPADAFCAVKYRDHWFWIDDRDFVSKRSFAFLMILFSLMETAGKGGQPIVTIPTG